MTDARSAVSALLVAIGALALAACASPGTPTVPQLVDAPMVTIDPRDADVLTEEELESWGYEGDGMTVELYDLMDAVTERYGSNEGFSGFEWSRESATLTLWWYGPVPAELAQDLAAHDPAVTTSPARNPPKALAEAARRIIAAGAVPGVFVSAAGPAIDCSELSVTAEANDPSTTEAEMAAAIERVAGFPVSLEVGRIVPISGTAEQR
jgi:hypothetical protein